MGMFSYNCKSCGHPLENRQNEAIVELLWESLPKDPDHVDRRQTGWGTKTQKGLVACVKRITDCQKNCEDCGPYGTAS